MSLDLQWDLLDSALAASLVDVLNRQLANAPRPSFIGPVEVLSLDFGTAAPDVEIVDLRDIYRDFLEVESDDEGDAESQNPPSSSSLSDDEDGGFEWVSRRSVPPSSAAGDGPAYHHLPPHIRYGGGPVQDMFASLPSLRSARDSWGSSMPASPLSMSMLGAFPGQSPLRRPPFSAHPFQSAFSAVPSPRFNPSTPLPGSVQASSSSSSFSAAASPPEPEAAPKPAPPTHPNVQMHLRIHWASNLRLTLSTSLAINYPSPLFLSLPIKLSVTGLVFDGELAVAYEGERRRVHLCILDELDPYGPLGAGLAAAAHGYGGLERPHAPAMRRTSTGGSSVDAPASDTGTPDEVDDAPPRSARPGEKPAPIGARLLPAIVIESEIGQADKHVLKNVTRVERFVQDVLRKTVEEELVFPNFHTVVLPPPA